MLLFKAAKLATGLRLLIVTAAPIITSSAALLSVRSAAYLVGFSLGNIGVTLWPIIATLITIAGIFGGSTQECDDYRAEVERVTTANQAIAAAFAPIIKAHYEQTAAIYAAWLPGYQKFQSTCYQNEFNCYTSCAGLCSFCKGRCSELDYGFPVYPIAPVPQYLFMPSTCTPPNCPISRKVWLQVIWASQSDFATQTKSCFLVGYSYDNVEGLKIEYNPFELSESFLKSRSADVRLVAGNRFTQLNDPDWENLESTIGWDKGYWAAEQTDVECRGWNPGWSRKVK